MKKHLLLKFVQWLFSFRAVQYQFKFVRRKALVIRFFSTNRSYPNYKNTNFYLLPCIRIVYSRFIINKYLPSNFDEFCISFYLIFWKIDVSVIRVN